MRLKTSDEDYVSSIRLRRSVIDRIQFLCTKNESVEDVVLWMLRMCEPTRLKTKQNALNISLKEVENRKKQQEQQDLEEAQVEHDRNYYKD